MAGSPDVRAQTQTVHLTADMRMRPGALSKADYDAIVAEAKEISLQTQDTRDLAHWPAQWRSGLTPGRLARLWSMPESAALEEPERDVLVEQAAQWDMLAFERPSDAAALWNRLWPLGQGGDPKAAPNSTHLILRPDAKWSDNAVALVSLFSCFPGAAWTAPGDPTVWATMHNASWQWRNASGWDGLRDCIRQTVAESAWTSNPATSSESYPANVRRTAAVDAILKAKFLRELARDGCRRGGPDSCLVIWQALYALDRKDPQLVAILHRMEPSFDLGRPVAMPVLDALREDRGASATTPSPSDATTTISAAKKRPRDELSEADRAAVASTLDEVERRKIFLTYKLPLLLEHPGAWRRGELDRSLRQAMALTVLVDRLQIGPGKTPDERMRYFNDPWQWIEGHDDPAIDATLRDLGTAYARDAGCDTDGLGIGTKLPSFWQGHAIELVRAGRSTGYCRAVDALDLPTVYSLAVHAADDAAAARTMAVFAPIDAALSKDGEVRTQALDAMKQACAEWEPGKARDPWALCAGVAERDARNAQAERERAVAEAAQLARAKAAESPKDPYACVDGMATVLQAVKALAYKGDADFWQGEQTACRRRPDRAGEAIVALTYTHGDQISGVATSPADDPGFDLDVVVIRTSDGSLLARTSGAHIDSDAVRFEGLDIDTADYQLAPGQRAFGIRIGHESHCYHCIFGQTGLTLYLQRGNRLDPILDTTVEDRSGDPDSSGCDDTPTTTTRTIKVARTASHGLADLEIDSTIKAEPDDDRVAQCRATWGNDGVRTDTITTSFDGTKYPLPVEYQAP